MDVRNHLPFLQQRYGAMLVGASVPAGNSLPNIEELKSA